MEATLRGLQAVGDSWRPMTRRHVLRMVCTSRIDYAAPLLHLWRLAKITTDKTRMLEGSPADKTAMKTTIKEENNAYKRLETHHKAALGWVIKHDGKKLHKLAISMTAIPSYNDRLPLLAFGLALHIRNASQYNVSQRLFNHPALPTGPLDLIWRLRDDSILPDFDEECAIERATNPDGPPLERAVFVRRRVLRILNLPDGQHLHTYIHPNSRSRSLVDRVLDIKDPASLRRALEWRKGTFGVYLTCGVCRKEKFTRRHTECMTRYAPWRHPEGEWGPEGEWVEEGELTSVDLFQLEDSFQSCVKEAKRAGKLMDYALGGRWNGEALVTLRRWEKAMKWMEGKVALKRSGPRKWSGKVVLKRSWSKVVLGR
ncbi:hypothetical protein P7C70_g2127, partial [Phenoliferia sp. Uapishka_3]